MGQFTVRANKEISELLESVVEITNDGYTNYPGMSYEDGIRDVLEWLCGDSPSIMEEN